MLRTTLAVLLFAVCGYGACVNELVDAIIMPPLPPTRLTFEALRARLAETPYQVIAFTIDHGTKRVGSFEIAPNAFAYSAHTDKSFFVMLSGFTLGTWQALGMSDRENVHLVIPENTTVCGSNQTLEEKDIMGAVGLLTIPMINPTLAFGCFKREMSTVCDLIYPNNAGTYSIVPFFVCWNVFTAVIFFILWCNWSQILSWAGPDMFRRGAQNVRGFGFMCASIFVPVFIWLPNKLAGFEAVWCGILCVSFGMLCTQNFGAFNVIDNNRVVDFPLLLYPAILSYVGAFCLTLGIPHVRVIPVILVFAMNASVVAACFAVVRFWATPANRFAHGLIAFNNFLARTVFPKDRLARFSVMSKKARDAFIAAYQRDLSDPHDTRTETEAFKDALFSLARNLQPEDATGVLETFVIDSAETPKADSLFRMDEEGHIAFRCAEFEHDLENAWKDMNYSQVIGPGLIIHFVAVIALSVTISAARDKQIFASLTSGFNIPVVTAFLASMAVACTNWAQRDATAAYEAIQTE